MIRITAVNERDGATIVLGEITVEEARVAKDLRYRVGVSVAGKDAVALVTDPDTWTTKSRDIWDLVGRIIALRTLKRTQQRGNG